MASLFRQITIVLSVLVTSGCAAGPLKQNAERSPAVDSSVVSTLSIPIGGDLRWPTADRFNNGWVIAANVFPRGPNYRVGYRALYLGWVGAQAKEGTIWSLSTRQVTRDGLADAWTVPLRSPRRPGVLFNVTFAVYGCGNIRALADILTPRMEPGVREIEIRNGELAAEQTFGDAVAFASLIDRSGDHIIQLWTGVRTPKDSLQPLFREFAACK